MFASSSFHRLINNQKSQVFLYLFHHKTFSTTAKLTQMTSPVSSSSRKDVDLFMSNEPRPIISINQGRYRGSNLNPPDLPQPIQRWLNIPYAFPPTGNLRFRPPFAIPTVPEDPNRPITDASEWGFRCPDSLNPTNDGTTDEKCLNLNVFRPKNYFDSSPEGAEKKPLLPVLLYIHGGGFNGGSARERMMSNLVSWAYSPIIAVSINYRVGPFGFLSGKVALGDGENGGVNVGLKDQRCAMLWGVYISIIKSWFLLLNTSVQRWEVRNGGMIISISYSSL